MLNFLFPYTTPANRTCCLTIITAAGILVYSYHCVKSVQLIWRSGTRRFHLRVPDLQMSCRDLTTWQGTRIVASVIVVRWNAPSFTHRSLMWCDSKAYCWPRQISETNAAIIYLKHWPTHRAPCFVMRRIVIAINVMSCGGRYVEFCPIWLHFDLSSYYFWTWTLLWMSFSQ